MTSADAATTLESEFAVSYDGPALRNGRIEVGDLAQALLALAALFREANAVVNPGEPSVTLHIRATGRGSFVVDLSLIHDSTIQDAVNVLTSDPATALVNLAEFVIAPAVGLFSVIKWLRNRRRTAEEPLPNGNVLMTFDDGSTFECPPEVLRMYDNLAIRHRARQVIKPLEREGITEVRLSRERNSTAETVISQTDIPAFDPPDLGTEDELLWENRYKFHLTIVMVAFAEDNKWRLYDGGQTVYYSIEDRDFLGRVQRSEEAFRKGDTLECEILAQQFRTGAGDLRIERSVTRVIAHHPAQPPEPKPELFDDMR